MTNRQLLLSAMVAKGYTAEKLADELNISRQSMSYRINNRRPFKSNEISIIAHLLGLSPAQIIDIFFDKQVGKNSTTEEWE